MVVPDVLVRQFLITVTYLMALSLIFTGGLQLFFTRFISDRLFERKHEAILPNLVGVLLLVTLAAGLLSAILLATLFDEPFAYRLLVMACLLYTSTAKRSSVCWKAASVASTCSCDCATTRAGGSCWCCCR